jgi:hypothetical protein
MYQFFILGAANLHQVAKTRRWFLAHWPAECRVAWPKMGSCLELSRLFKTENPAMKRLLMLTALAGLTVGSTGCNCCGTRGAACRPTYPAPACAPVCAPACAPMNPCGTTSGFTGYDSYSQGAIMTQPTLQESTIIPGPAN